MQIRDYAPEDFPAIAKLHEAEYASIGESKETLAEQLAKENARCLVFVSGEEICGFLQYFEDKPKLFINWIVMAPALRGKGLISAGSDALVQRARHEGFESLSLVTRNRFKAALCMYISRGFEITGTYPHPVDGDVMIKLELRLK